MPWFCSSTGVVPLPQKGSNAQVGPKGNSPKMSSINSLEYPSTKGYHRCTKTFLFLSNCITEWYFSVQSMNLYSLYIGVSN